MKACNRGANSTYLGGGGGLGGGGRLQADIVSQSCKMWTDKAQLDIPLGRRRTWRRRWTASRAGKHSSNLRSYQTPQLTCQTCMQRSSTLCNREVVVDLVVTGLMDTGNQQAVGLYSLIKTGSSASF